MGPCLPNLSSPGLVRLRLVTISLMLLGACAGGMSHARPADWYLWQSKLEKDKTLCSQTSPGDGWEKLSGPYRDARCELQRK